MSPLETLLEAEGYTIAFRENGWCECLLVHDGERWVGAGLTQDGALDDVLRRACPSNLARSLLFKAITSATAPGNDAAAVEPCVETAAVEPCIETTPVEPCIETAPVEPVAAHDDREERQEDEMHGQHVAPSVVSSASDAPDPRVELEDIFAEIDSAEEELGLCAPKRQRLALLAWAARARAVQDVAPELSTAVGAITRRLGALGRAWWPGSVPALTRTSRPENLRGLVPLSDRPTWRDVGKAAASELTALDDAPANAAHDAHGWADAAAASPPPDDPDHLLLALADQMALAGPLGTLPREDAPRPTPSELLTAVRQLRWIRLHVAAATLWASVAGRVRWWCATGGGEYSEARKEFDPAFAPSRPWRAVVLGEQESRERERREEDVRRAREREARLVLDRAPVAGCAPHTVVEWLVEALALADLSWDRVASALAPFREVVLAVGESDLPAVDRRLRRRLRRVQEALSGDSGRGLQEQVASAPDAEPDAADVPQEVLAVTRGRRAVFVGNCQDDDLCDKLAVTFDFQTIRFVEAEPRRIDALVASIARTGVDIVLFASGFAGHSCDAKVKRACDLAGVTFLRVNKGRPNACVRAVARAFGLGARRQDAA